MRQLALVLVVVFGVVNHAHADPAAEQLFRDGLELLKKGKIAEACDRFARSQKLEARTGTLLRLGDCREQLGMTASAWETFMEAKSTATIGGDTRRAAEANRRATALKPKLAYLTISVPSDRVVTGFELRRNGEVLDQAVWNVAVPIDPGEYKLVASAPGHESWSGNQAIVAGQRATIVVDPLVKIATIAPTTTVTPTTTTAGTAPQEPASSVVKTSSPERDVIEPTPSLRHWAIGVSFGESHALDPSFGARAIRSIPISKGALRASVSVLYDNFNDDDTNGFMRSDQALIGGGIEYAWLTERFAFGGGVMVGVDLLFRNSDRGTDAGAWFGARISPLTVRLLDGQLEAGLHLQGIQSKDRVAAFGLVGVDWYVF